MEATTTYLEDEKRWQTGLLWRFDRMHLPDSYQMAVKRLKCLEAKMSKDPPLKEFMMNTMHDYKQKGYIRRLMDITNPNKKKTRLVWDAATKVSGMSLNDCLLKGPVSGDIREMFHQVKARQKDHPAQKFLWRGGDSSRFPETYVMQVMTFGASCSPALANYVKNRKAERFVAEHPDAVKAICEKTFVDDWLQSVDTGAEMIQLAETEIHASGGFEMRRWTSNSKQVIQALEDDCEELDKRISAQDDAQEKVLGLWWLPGQDLLTFVVTPNLLAKASERPTKRRVLSVIMSIFDPLGLLGFFNIRAKIILQNVWRSNIGWDDDLTNEDEADWQHWLDLLSNLNAVRIPRCMKWVASKMRVAPRKPVSIPRMELMAAVLGLRLAKCIQKEMSVRIHTRTFWTDSKDVLYWIRSDARKFQQFIALRIGEILEESDGYHRLKTWQTMNNPITRRPGDVFCRICSDGGLDLQKTLLLKRSNEMDVIFIRICQEEEFYSEITCLRSGRRLTNRKSLLFKCSPYVDDSGILRIGRIDNIEGVKVCVKCPIILPRRHQLTYLLVEFYHRRYHHLHNEIVVNQLRQRYWPPGLGDLPIERLLPYTPPFTYTGMDYFGPYDIVVGRRREKRWSVLFTCLTVRAVHLDIATTLSTDSYLCVLKSFVARRGCTRRMLSDNGTTFRGASRVLKDERISPALIEQQYPELEFTFIPPGSPHMGGSWEQMMRSTKSILSDTLPPSGLREEVLRAALADVIQADCVREGSSQLADQFWKRWLREYLPTLTRRTKWFQPPHEPISVDDIVIIVDDGAKRNCWTRGVVVDVHRSKDGQVRSAVVRTADEIITRPAVKLAKRDIKVGNTLNGRS
ncbi:uncharacterized protein [Drosophila virilis]|uniref:uncharacterized protein n=1 Tax=Drosophila virilis TaxID=7244 RepID=UPI0038B3BB5D